MRCMGENNKAAPSAENQELSKLIGVGQKIGFAACFAYSDRAAASSFNFISPQFSSDIKRCTLRTS